jgi:hypothetical protein
MALHPIPRCYPMKGAAGFSYIQEQGNFGQNRLVVRPPLSYKNEDTGGRRKIKYLFVVRGYATHYYKIFYLLMGGRVPRPPNITRTQIRNKEQKYDFIRTDG